MQRVREVEPLSEAVERSEDGAAVFDRDVLDADEARMTRAMFGRANA